MSEPEKPVKILCVTPDFKPPDTIGKWYQRVFTRIVKAEIRPSTDSVIECYCETCDGTFAGNWFEHQESVHGRSQLALVQNLEAIRK